MKHREFLLFSMCLLLILAASSARADGMDPVSCMEHMGWAGGLLMFAGLFLFAGLVAIVIAVRRDPNCEVLRPFDHRVGRDCYRDNYREWTK